MSSEGISASPVWIERERLRIPGLVRSTTWYEHVDPIGVQLGVAVGEDPRVLQVSRPLERALPWHGRRAPLATS